MKIVLTLMLASLAVLAVVSSAAEERDFEKECTERMGRTLELRSKDYKYELDNACGSRCYNNVQKYRQYKKGNWLKEVDGSVICCCGIPHQRFLDELHWKGKLSYNPFKRSFWSHEVYKYTKAKPIDLTL